MGLEFVYQTKYESTIDTLALRENVKKILQNAAVKSNAVGETLNTHENVELKPSQELKSTINFLNSKAALKLLNLTKRDPELITQQEYADILDFKVDESKKNIFAA